MTCSDRGSGCESALLLRKASWRGNLFTCPARKSRKLWENESQGEQRLLRRANLWSHTGWAKGGFQLWVHEKLSLFFYYSSSLLYYFPYIKTGNLLLPYPILGFGQDSERLPHGEWDGETAQVTMTAGGFTFGCRSPVPKGGLLSTCKVPLMALWFSHFYCQLGWGKRHSYHFIDDMKLRGKAGWSLIPWIEESGLKSILTEHNNKGSLIEIDI